MKVEDLLSRKNKDYFYIMHLSYQGRERERLWNYAKENNLIGLDYSRLVKDDWNRIRKPIQGLPRIWVRQFEIFCNAMKKGDIVLILSGQDSLLGIAEIIESRYQYDRNLSEGIVESFFDHIRQVRWLREYEYANRLTIPQSIKGFNNTLCRVEPPTRRWSILKNLNI